MSNVAKFLIIVNLLLAGVFVGSAANFLGQKDWVQAKNEAEITEWKAKHAATETERARLDGENKRLSGENNTLKAEILQQRTLASEATKEAESLRQLLNTQGANLTRATSALELQNSQLTAQQAEITRLSKESAEAKASRDTEHLARTAAEALQASLQQQLNDETAARKDSEAVLAETKRENQELQAQVEAIKSKLPGLDLGTPQPAITPGKVLAADNAMGLVVVSLGEEDGLKRGYKYIVSRGNQYVATIQITDVQAKKATAQVVKGMQKSPVQANDTVMNP